MSYGERARLVSFNGAAAGSASDRAADIMDAFADPSVDAVFAADGGAATRDVLPYLDAAVIAESRKAFIGYSDNVYLNQYLVSYADLASYCGCCFMVHFGEAGGPYPETVRNFRDAVMSGEQLVCRPAPSRTNDWTEWFDPVDEPRVRDRFIPGGWTWARRGRGAGQFGGGEISILPDLLKTFAFPVSSMVLFWDVTTTNDEPIRPQFRRLAETCDLDSLSGMVVGAHTGMAPTRWVSVVRQLVRDFLTASSFPVMVNADISHLSPPWILPFGRRAVLDDSIGLVFEANDADVAGSAAGRSGGRTTEATSVGGT